ncbi:MAG: secretin N-terminal domain-containing protein [Candidatus Aminicenantales bacterium]
MKKITLLALFAMGMWGCVMISQSYRLGTQAEMNQNWDEAIQFYEKAALENPKDPVYRIALDRVKIKTSLYYVREARQLAAQGKKEEAKAAYARALSYNPRDMAIAMEAKALAEAPEKEPEPAIEKIEFPIALQAKEESLDLKFPSPTSLRAIFETLGKAAGINVIFDENFRDILFAIDLTNKSFKQAMRSLCLASKNFYRIVDEKTVIVVPDQPLKRMQYEVNVIKTFYLSNVNAQDMLSALSQMLRTQVRAPNIIFDKNLNSITIKDTPQNIELVGKLLKIWDKPKGEVIIDLEIMEVSRVKLRQLGLDFDQNVLGFRYGGTEGTNETSWFNLKDIDFSKASNFSLSLPISFIQFLEKDADTKIIAQPRLRGVADEPIRHLVGQKVPIPRATFSPIAAGGVSQQPIVSYDLQDVGMEVMITPRVHFEKEITLTLEIKVTSIGGTGIADIPILNTREVKNVIRLKDGETNLLAGLLRNEERKSLKGIPGLKDIPLIGRLFSAEDTTIEQTDVILMITPYIIRTIPLTPEDLKPLWVDMEEVSAAERPGLAAFEEDVLGRELDAEAARRALERRRAVEAENQIFINPVNFEAPQGREFRVSVNIRCNQDIGNLSLNLNFDANRLTLKDVVEGGFIRQLREAVPFFKNIDNTAGVCTIGFSSPEPGRGLKGGGNLATLLFEAKSQGESKVSIAALTAISSVGQVIHFQTSESRIIIR